jgi:hypothetical protein
MWQAQRQPIWRGGLQRLWTVSGGRLKQRVSEEEYCNNAMVILALLLM